MKSTALLVVMLVIGSFFGLFLTNEIPNVSASSHDIIRPITNHYDFVMSQKINSDNLWSIGNNLQDGDYYQYKICNDKFMVQEIHPYHCYNVSLEFITILDSYKGKQWIVQSYLTYGNQTTSSILFVDPITFDVTTDPLNVNLGLSLENTLFSLSQYGAKSLDIGTVWDDMDSYFTNSIPLEIKKHQVIDLSNLENIDTVILGYDIIVPSSHYIVSDFAFPVKSIIYSPHIIFPEPKALHHFEMLNYNSTYHQSSFSEPQNAEDYEVQSP